MGRTSKGLTLLFVVVLAASSLIIAKPADAQSIPKPSIPEFTLKFVDSSYVTRTGYHVDNRSIEVTIKNQAFTDYTDSNGNDVWLSYNIQWKKYYEDYWHTHSPDNSWLTASRFFLTSDSLVYPNTPCTVLIYSLGELRDGTFLMENISAGGQVDFQVKALIGYYTKAPSKIGGGPILYDFTGEASGWSNTQTISISNLPQISVLSLQAENYTDSSVPLNFTVDNPVTQILYSLDGKDNVTVNGNTTLTGLSNGLHNVTVYVNDIFNNTVKSETVNFTIAVPEPFPTLTVVAVCTVAVVAVGAGLLVYFKKRKR